MNWSSKVLVMLTTIVALFLVTSCTPAATGPDITQPFIGGTIGLNTYLMQGMPPEMVYDNGNYDFSIGVALENLGEADVGPVPGADNPFVMVRIIGVNPEQFGITDADTVLVLNDPLRGAKRNFDGTVFPGEITIASFEGLRYIPDIHGNAQFTIRAELCYDYETFSTTKICIKDRVLENIQDSSICTLSGDKFPQNSGAPIHVKSVVQNPMADNKIQINFVVEHVGIGEFFGRTRPDGSQENCDFSVRNINKYNVDVEVDPLTDAGMTIQCPRLSNSNRGTIKLYQGAPTTVSCTLTRTRSVDTTNSLVNPRVYEDLLNIRLRYRYGQFIETPIIIQDVSI